MVVGEANKAGTFNRSLNMLECNSQNKNQLQRSGLKRWAWSPPTFRTRNKYSHKKKPMKLSGSLPQIEAPRILEIQTSIMAQQKSTWSTAHEIQETLRKPQWLKYDQIIIALKKNFEKFKEERPESRGLINEWTVVGIHVRSDQLPKNITIGKKVHECVKYVNQHSKRQT